MQYSTVILFVLVMISAYYVVSVRHENRVAFSDVHSLEGQRNQLQVEQGRLVLERATLSIQHQIAAQAKTQLDMVPPPSDRIVTVR